MALWLLTEILGSLGVAAERTDMRNYPGLGTGNEDTRSKNPVKHKHTSDY